MILRQGSGLCCRAAYTMVLAVCLSMPIYTEELSLYHTCQRFLSRTYTLWSVPLLKVSLSLASYQRSGASVARLGGIEAAQLVQMAAAVKAQLHDV